MHAEPKSSSTFYVMCMCTFNASRNLPPSGPNLKPNHLRAQGGSRKFICWGALPLDPDHLNTQPEQLSTYGAPTDPVRLMRALGRDRDLDDSPPSAGCYGIAVGMGGSSSSSSSSSSLPPPPLRTDAALAAEVCLTRC